jgi:predicted transcriptional regulator of viral defense system
MKKKNDFNYFEDLKKRLPPVFKMSRLLAEVEAIRAQEGEFDGQKIKKKLALEIEKNIKNINLKAPFISGPSELHTFEIDFNFFDICIACTEDRFFCNLSAIYLLGLTEQRPNTFYLAKETHAGSKIVQEYNQSKVRQAFMKKSRNTTKYIEYHSERLFFLEKQTLSALGVIEQAYNLEKHNPIKYRVTNIERTFLDSVITPQYSGGVKFVLEVFANAKIDVDQLYKIYNKLNPYYPYWQRVGFFLDKIGHEDEAQAWQRKFQKKELKEFYIDKEFRSTWVMDSKWNILYPEGFL